MTSPNRLNRQVFQAFLAPLGIAPGANSRHASLSPASCPLHRATARAAPRPRPSAPAHMTTTPPSAGGDDAPATDDDNTTSASDILKTLREDSAADMEEETVEERQSRSMLGVYRDVDGRSNVWAVEPTEEEDTAPQISKTTVIAFSAIFIITALLILPLLPFTNPDQI